MTTHRKVIMFLSIFVIFQSTTAIAKSMSSITLEDGIDVSAGNLSSYVITTPTATYFLEKSGGGLSSMIDKDGVDWMGFNNVKGSGWKGEYRGFPNAIHKQDGNYFHAMNAKTELASSVVNIKSDKHIQIEFTSNNKQWKGRWDFTQTDVILP